MARPEKRLVTIRSVVAARTARPGTMISTARSTARFAPASSAIAAIRGQRAVIDVIETADFVGPVARSRLKLLVNRKRTARPCACNTGPGLTTETGKDGSKWLTTLLHPSSNFI